MIKTDRTNTIIEQYLMGLPVTKIAQKNKTTQYKVKKILEKANVFGRKKPTREETIQARYDLYKSGLTYKEIADIYKVSPRTIYASFKEAGLATRSRGWSRPDKTKYCDETVGGNYKKITVSVPKVLLNYYKMSNTNLSDLVTNLLVADMKKKGISPELPK